MFKCGLQSRAAYIDCLTPCRAAYNQGRLTINFSWWYRMNTIPEEHVSQIVRSVSSQRSHSVVKFNIATKFKKWESYLLPFENKHTQHSSTHYLSTVNVKVETKVVHSNGTLCYLNQWCYGFIDWPKKWSKTFCQRNSYNHTGADQTPNDKLKTLYVHRTQNHYSYAFLSNKHRPVVFLTETTT